LSELGICLQIYPLSAENAYSIATFWVDIRLLIGQTSRFSKTRKSSRGKSGKVLTVDHQKGTLVVEGVQFTFRHIKPSQKNPEGGRLRKESPIRASKVMAICPKTNKPTRIGYRYLEDGSKERFARISGTSLGEIAPPKAAYAKK